MNTVTEAKIKVAINGFGRIGTSHSRQSHCSETSISDKWTQENVTVSVFCFSRCRLFWMHQSERVNTSNTN